MIIFILFLFLNFSNTSMAMHPALLAAVNIASIVGKKSIIPDQEKFTDRGIVLEQELNGSWDSYLFGSISPSSVIKKGDTYYLYYIGASKKRTTDNGPAWRALGVATSKDGINFTKYHGNPIVDIFPQNNQEEGNFSAATTLDDYGNIVLYYTVAEAPDSTSESVSSKVFVATSSDGLNFYNHQEVLNYRNSNVWGYGDELFPIGVFHKNGQWNLYYIAKGYHAYWELGVASGPERNKLTTTKPVLTGEGWIIGGGDPIVLPNGEIVTFIMKDFETRTIEARKIDKDDPSKLLSPSKIYQFEDLHHSVIYYDKDKNQYFLYYLNEAEDAIKLKTASP